MAALRSGASTLRAKNFAIDRERLFIGSFNLDPRSIELITEHGFVIDSPELARQIADTFEKAIPEAAYEAVLNNSRLAWREVRGEATTLHIREPNMSALDNMIDEIFKWLPVHWLL